MVGFPARVGRGRYPLQSCSSERKMNNPENVLQVDDRAASIFKTLVVDI